MTPQNLAKLMNICDDATQAAYDAGNSDLGAAFANLVRSLDALRVQLDVAMESQQ